MWVAILLVALLAIIGLSINAAIYTFLWLKIIFKKIKGLPFGIIFGSVVLIITVIFYMSMSNEKILPQPIIKIGNYAIGLLLFYLFIVGIISLILLICKLVRAIPSPMLDKVRLSIGCVVFTLIFGLFMYGSIHWTNIKTKEYDIMLRQVEQNEENNLRITLISDIHIGYIVGENHLEEIVNETNETNPDIICIAGDIFDGDKEIKNPDKIQALLKEFKSTYGVYACLGNHDAGANFSKKIEFLEEANINVLQDEVVIIDDKIVLAGRKDSSPIGGGEKRNSLILPDGTDDMPLIVMDHQPGNIDEYNEETDLILCGHTHQGQVFPLNLITNAMYEVDYGYYKAENGPQVIVTSGAGTWGPPLRIGTDNEIAVIEISFPKK